MVRSSHEEKGLEDLKPTITRFEQNVATFTEIVLNSWKRSIRRKKNAQHYLSVKRRMLSMSALKERSLQSLVIKFFISSYNSLFTLEAKLKIPLMIEKLNCLLKRLEAYFNLDRIREEQQNSFSCLKMSSHALVLWESYVDALRVGKKPIAIKWNTSRNNQSIINNA